MSKLNLAPEKNYHSIRKIESPDNVLMGLCFSMDHSLSDPNQFDLILETVEHADRLGFHFAWVFDKYCHVPTGIKLNPAILHSAISVRTSQIELRGACLSSARRDAIRTVEDWSIIDNLSNGRIGVLVPYDIEEPGLDSSFATHISELRSLWSGGTVKRINGVGNEVEVKIFPRPIQKELPIWVPIINAANEWSFKKAGEFGFNLLTPYEDENRDAWLNNIQHYRNAALMSEYPKGRSKVTMVMDIYFEENYPEQTESTTRSPDMMVDSSDVLLKLVESSQIKIPKNRFHEVYNSIKNADPGIDEIAFKIDLSDGREVVFNKLERLRKFF